MNSRSILKLTCKIFGIYFLVQSFNEIKSVLIYYSGSVMSADGLYAESDDYFSAQRVTLIIMLMAIVGDLIIAFLLFSRSEWIVNKLDRNGNEDGGILPATRALYLELTVVAIGIFLFASAIPEIITSFVQYVLVNKRDNDALRIFWSGNRTEILISSVVESVVALVIVSNGKSIAKRIDRIGNINAGEGMAETQ